MRFLHDDRWRFGICSASSTESGYSPDTTRLPLRTFPWRSGTGATDHWITCDTGGASPANFVAIANPVIVGMSGTLKLQYSPDNAAWTDAVIIPTSVTPRTRLWVAYFNTVSARYYRLLWQRITGTGYVEFGVVRVGSYFQPTYPPDLPLNLQRNDLSRITRGGSGNINRSKQDKQSTFDLNFPSMPSADIGQFDLMYESLGIGNPFFIAVDEALLEETFYGYIISPLGKEPIAGDEWDVKLSCEEAL